MGKKIEKYSGKVTEFYFPVPQFTIDDFVDIVDDDKLEYFWDNYTDGDGDYLSVDSIPVKCGMVIEDTYFNEICSWMESVWRNRKGSKKPKPIKGTI